MLCGHESPRAPTIWEQGRGIIIKQGRGAKNYFIPEITDPYECLSRFCGKIMTKVDFFLDDIFVLFFCKKKKVGFSRNVTWSSKRRGRTSFVLIGFLY